MTKADTILKSRSPIGRSKSRDQGRCCHVLPVYGCHGNASQTHHLMLFIDQDFSKHKQWKGYTTRRGNTLMSLSNSSNSAEAFFSCAFERSISLRGCGYTWCIYVQYFVTSNYLDYKAYKQRNCPHLTSSSFNQKNPPRFINKMQDREAF